MDGFHTDAFKATQKSFLSYFGPKAKEEIQKRFFLSFFLSLLPPKNFFPKNFLINFALIQHQKSSNWYIINGENISI